VCPDSKGPMLTEEEKALLERVFAAEGIKELTTRQTEKIASQTKIAQALVEQFALSKGIKPLRYQRNIGVFGRAGQSSLLGKTVVIVGLGGLGGHVLEQTARAGVGHIIGIDPDVFEETNLNRQLLCSHATLGCKKVSQAETHLKKINPAVEFTGHPLQLDRIAPDLWQGADLVFDCLDNIEDRLALAGRCSKADVPLVHGAVAGWYGQVGVIWPGAGTLEKIYSRQQRGIEQRLGTPPFTAAVVASLMVAKGIRLLLGRCDRKENRLLFFDLLEDDWQTVDFS